MSFKDAEGYFAAIVMASLTPVGASAALPPNQLISGYTNGASFGGTLTSPCYADAGGGQVFFRRNGVSGNALLNIPILLVYPPTGPGFTGQGTGSASMVFTNPTSGTIHFDVATSSSPIGISSYAFSGYSQTVAGEVVTVSFTYDFSAYYAGCLLPVTYIFRIKG